MIPFVEERIGNRRECRLTRSGPFGCELRARHEYGQRNQKAATKSRIARLAIGPRSSPPLYHHGYGGRSMVWVSQLVANSPRLRQHQDIRLRVAPKADTAPIPAQGSNPASASEIPV